MWREQRERRERLWEGFEEEEEEVAGAAAATWLPPGSHLAPTWLPPGSHLASYIIILYNFSARLSLPQLLI